MKIDFDLPIDRRHSDSHKWNKYGPDVLPLWIADMDFASPPCVLEALHERVNHGVFGLPVHPPEELSGIIIDMMAERYHWQIKQEEIIYLSATHDSFKLACRLVGEPGDGVLMQTPLYPPLLVAPGKGGRQCQTAPLARGETGFYTPDFTALSDAVTDKTRLFMFCNPHNPTGRVFTAEELERTAEFCLRNKLMICSDDVHFDLIYQGHQYRPMAAVSPEVAEKCITLISFSKAYNLPGLKLSVAIVKDKETREKIRGQLDNYPASLFGMVAATAALKSGGEWHRQLMDYLQENRDFLLDFLAQETPEIDCYQPEATFLAWLDCRNMGIDENPYDFFLGKGKVALDDGRYYGEGGAGFVRLNFGCPRPILAKALQRMKAALHD